MASTKIAARNQPPKPYRDFVSAHPLLGQAWELTARAGLDGPLDAREARLIKLAIAAGALREGAVRASVRKAAELGVSRAELSQVVALTAGTLGFPAAVAVSDWIDDEQRSIRSKRRR